RAESTLANSHSADFMTALVDRPATTAASTLSLHDALPISDDLLPYREQDERLEQGYEATGDEDEDQVALWELGLGRSRVLSPEGRSEAAERWLEGDFGPRQKSGRGRRGTVAANCTS